MGEVGEDGMKIETRAARDAVTLKKLKMARNKKRMWMFGKTMNNTLV